MDSQERKDIIDEITAILVPTFSQVVDYARQSVETMIEDQKKVNIDFRNEYDKKLESLERSMLIIRKGHKILEARIIPRSTLFVLGLGTLISLIIALILILV